MPPQRLQFFKIVQNNKSHSEYERANEEFMTTLLLSIREPDDAHAVVEDITAAICPYLRIFGEQATISAVDCLREFGAGVPDARAMLLRLSLAGSARVPFATLVSKLERFLRQAAKDLEMVIKFDLLLVESVGIESECK